MTTLATGAGLIGTELARCAVARGEAVVFVDPQWEVGAMVWGVPPAPDYLRSRPPMPAH
jgi:NADPH-dependent 2,4-dienoyl-CoA reductase/sulfur reductase-like enzyme